MDIKLIAVDMDGTLLDDEKRIPAENLRALRECAEAGIEIVPASGRMVSGLPEEVLEFPGLRYAITINGAKVVDLWENRTISSCSMPVETAVKIMEMARDYPSDILYDAYVDGVGYTTEHFYYEAERYLISPAAADMMRRTRRIFPDNIAAVAETAKEVDKLNLYFVDGNARLKFYELLKGVPGILVSSSVKNNLEVNAAGADKGGALLRLAELLGLKREELMAFGDRDNDLTMIRAAGLGVVMGNGDECVIAEADYVTLSNNEAGVAAAIDKFVLKRGISWK